MKRDPEASAGVLRWCERGAALVLFGTLTSEPLSLWLVNASHPQPPWRDASTFVAHYHPVQTVPFFFGFALVGGFVALIAALHALAEPELRPRLTVALALTAAFAAMILVNYAIQTTFVPLLATADHGAGVDVVGAFTMSNPRSLGWSLEMWGYAVLGVATWLAAGVFESSGVERVAGTLFVLNGPLSIASALLTAWVPGWVLTAPGLVGFAVWNFLIVVMAAAAWLATRQSRASRGGFGLAQPG